eukprot:SAG31_NODE_113_length_24342_cov_5.194530_8_plen_165_part_00
MSSAGLIILFSAHRAHVNDRFSPGGVDLGIPRDLPDLVANDVGRRLQKNRFGHWGLDFEPNAVRSPRRFDEGKADRHVLDSSPKYCALSPSSNLGKTGTLDVNAFASLASSTSEPRVSLVWSPGCFHWCLIASGICLAQSERSVQILRPVAAIVLRSKQIKYWP